MSTVIIAVILICICIGYGFASKYYYQTDDVITVEAGKIGDCEFVSGYSKLPPRIIKLNNGKYINSKDYIRIRINGSCMMPRNILNGEEWLVKPIDKTIDISLQITPKDVLLIHISDKDVYKIREFKSVNIMDNNYLDTFYYKNGRVHDSSKPHSKESIIGIVKYSI